MNKIFKGVISILFIITIAISCTISASAYVGIKQVTAIYSDIKFERNYNPISPIYQPIIIENITYLPIRSIEYLLNIKVRCDDRVLFVNDINFNDFNYELHEIQTSEKDERTIDITYNHFSLVANNKVIILYDMNDNRIEPFSAGNLINDSSDIYIPLRALAEVYDYNVNWDCETNTIILTENKIIDLIKYVR